MVYDPKTGGYTSESLSVSYDGMTNIAGQFRSLGTSVNTPAQDGWPATDGVGRGAVTDANASFVQAVTHAITAILQHASNLGAKMEGAANTYRQTDTTVSHASGSAAQPGRRVY